MATISQTFSKDRGKVFVSGLFWQSLPPGKAVRKAQIDKIAKEQSFDLIVLRNTGTTQVGFASSKAGFSAGMLSAAGMISKTADMLNFGRNILIALEIDKKRWLYFAQQEGVTYPDGDFIGLEDEVRARINKDLLGEIVYDKIIAPSHWDIAKSVPMELSDFYPIGKKAKKLMYKNWWALKPIKKNYFSSTYVLAILLSVLAISGCTYLYKQWQENKALEEIQAFARQQEALETKSKLRIPTALPQVVHPWKDKPRAIIFANGCLTTFTQIHTLFPGGWTFRDALCAGNTLVVSWTRPPTGRIDYLLEIEPRVIFTPDFGTATLILPVITNVELEESLSTGVKRAQILMDSATKLNLKMVFGAVNQPPLPNQPPNTKTPQLANWTEQTWSIPNLDKSLIGVITVLDAGGFRIDSIQTRLVDGMLNYTLQGVQYGNP